MSYSERLSNWCDKVCAFFDWDLEKETKDWNEKGSRRIHVHENLRKAIFKAKAEAPVYYGRNISTLYELIPTPDRWGAGWANAINFEKASDFTEENIIGMFNYANLIKELVELYEEWDKNEFADLMRGLTAHNKFKDPDFKLHPSILEAINSLVIDRSFKSYIYVDTGERINNTDAYFIASKIGFSKDLTMWLEHCQNQKEFLETKNRDEVYVTLFGKLDEIDPIYSNWLFTIHKKGTIWIVTDQVAADNPHQKRGRLSRAGLWRERGEHRDSCDLPFNFFDDLSEAQKNTTTLAKTDNQIREPFAPERKESTKSVEERIKVLLDKHNIAYDVVRAEYKDEYWDRWGFVIAKKAGVTVAYWQEGMADLLIYDKPEVLFRDVDEMLDAQKAFLLILVNELVQYISSQDLELPKIMTAKEFINQKLLEGAKIDPVSEDTHMEYWTARHKQRFMELTETFEFIEGKKTTAVQVLTYDLVVKTAEYSSSYLATPEKQASLSEWLLLEDERLKFKPLWDKLEANREPAGKWLKEKYDTEFENVLKRLSLASSIEFKTSGMQGHSGFIRDDKVPDELKWIGQTNIIKRDKKSVYDKMGEGFGRTGDWRHGERCRCCNNYDSKEAIRIQIRYYKVLMWLLGIENRMDLPPYYQNYRAHDLIPYTGNSLLQQTHPYLRIYDPLSKREPNGFSLHLWMCGHCLRKNNFAQETLEIVL